MAFNGLVQGDAVTEWIQDYMLEKYDLEEVWLPTREALAASGISNQTATPSKSSREKRVHFGSKATPRIHAQGSVEDDRRSDDGSSWSDESESAIQWSSTPRTGIFTIDELDLPRVSPQSLIQHARCNVFISRDFWKCERLLVLIQGSGAVRPGQWSRSVCITHNIHYGAMFNYLNIARETGMGVILLNPNANQIKLRVLSLDQPVGNISAQHTYDIPGHNTHISHVLSVYDNFIAHCQAKELYFVANGRGGDTLLQLLNHRLDVSPSKNGPDHLPTLKRQGSNVSNNLQQTRAVAFINSAHSVSYAKNDTVKSFIEERSVHWLTSTQPLDTAIPEQDDNFGCTCVSSGHNKADFAAASAINSVFDFFLGRIPPNEPKPDWNPVPVPFSNPPQNMHLINEENSSDNESIDFNTANPSEEQPGSTLLESASHSSSERSFTSQPPRLDFSHSRTDYEFSIPPVSPAIGQKPEMIEMGTQTDPIQSVSYVNGSGDHSSETRPLQEVTLHSNRNTAIRNSIANPLVQPFVLSLCPICRFSLWIQESKLRSFLSIALIIAGVVTSRLLLGGRRREYTLPAVASQTSQKPRKSNFFF